MERITAYHGSTLTNCENIKDTQKFKISTSSEKLFQSLISGNNSYQWLGDGIYFWPNNFRRAKYWAETISSKYNERAAVIRVPLIYEEKRCFDLRKKENYKPVHEIIEKTIENFHEHICIEELPRDDKNKFIGYVCDMLFSTAKMEYDLVYYDFIIDEDEVMPYLSAQICVKNDKVINYAELAIV